MTWTEEARVGRAPVDPAPLREAFLASGLPANEVARRLGWMRPPPKGKRSPVPDQGRLRSALGLRPYNPGHGYPMRMRSGLRHETAERIARAINVDPWEVGL
jgi:hypothetical protein